MMWKWSAVTKIMFIFMFIKPFSVLDVPSNQPSSTWFSHSPLVLFLFRLSWGLQTPLDLMQKVYGDRMRQKAILVAMNGGNASQPWRPMGPMGRGWSQAMGWFGKPIGEWSLPREGQMDEGQKWNTQKHAARQISQGWRLKIVSPKTGHSNTKDLASHFGLPLAHCWNPEIISLYTTGWDHHFCCLNRPGAWRSGAGLLFPAWWTRLWSGANGSISIRDQVLSPLHSTCGGCDGCLGWYYLANVKPGFWQFLQFINEGLPISIVIHPYFGVIPQSISIVRVQVYIIWGLTLPG